MQSNTDISIDDLYVPHYISSGKISLDDPLDVWKPIDPVDFLLKEKRLVVLGDPGTGKSTLVNWFAWYLASGFSRRLPGDLDGLLPLPIVLRDLIPTALEGVEDLVDSFLRLPVAARLPRDVVLEYVLSGRCLFLIDGLDEVAQSFGLSVHTIMSAAEGYGYYLLTSRIVGYSNLSDSKGSHPKSSQTKVGVLESPLPKVSREVVCYIAPFNDEQIRKFSFNWYRGQGGHAAVHLSEEFIEAINSDLSIKSLARTPNLLTMMAQIYRVRARLPNGRALLYDDIAQAYLESIDTARKMKDEFSWKTKRRWLARIAFEMQILRSGSAELSGARDNELLVDREDILKWLNEAIADGDGIRDEAYASKYLDWIARRSGLLLPRGEGQYAFLHLSFQEYFAARYLMDQLEHPLWPAATDDRVVKKALRKWFNSYSWSQVFTFLFELFSGKPGWIEKIVGILWAWRKQWPAKSKYMPAPASKVLVELLINPHAGFSPSLRSVYVDQVISDVVFEQFKIGESICSAYVVTRIEKTLFVRLLNSGLTRDYALGWMARSPEAWVNLVVDEISREALIAISSYIPKMKALRSFSANYVDIENCDLLSGLEELSAVSLKGSSVKDINGLQGCPGISRIFIDGTEVAGVEVIRDMSQLVVLDMDGTKVSDISMLGAHEKLRCVSLCRTPVTDISVFQGNKSITHIGVSETSVNCLESLSDCRLVYVDIAYSDVCSLDFLKDPSGLMFLAASGCRISDLRALAKASELREIWINKSDVTDLSPLRACKKLSRVKFDFTAVSDVSPLAKIKNLRQIDADQSAVTDVSPLRALKKLNKISLVGCDIKDFSALSGMDSLAIIRE